jgi:hypothetical protein
MPKKKSAPAIIKVNPNARSFRSMAVGWCTLLFDADYESKFRNSNFDPFQVCRLEQPKTAFETMSEWAGKGIWCAIESHPEIADADGVPGLDLIFAKDGQLPNRGEWIVSGTQLLDLPSGVLTIVYEPEFFEDWYQEEYPTFDAEDAASECLGNREFCDATSFTLPVQPGFYTVHAFTRDLATDPNFDGRHAQLVVVLVPTQRPVRFGTANPLIQYAG